MEASYLLELILGLCWYHNGKKKLKSTWSKSNECLPAMTTAKRLRLASAAFIIQRSHRRAGAKFRARQPPRRESSALCLVSRTDVIRIGGHRSGHEALMRRRLFARVTLT